MKLGQYIAEAAQRLEDADLAFGHGTDNAWDEAAWLVLHAAGLPVTEPADLDMELGQEQAAAARNLIEQRITTRKPTAYLTGTAWFAGLPFDTSEDVIVPRSHLAGFLLEQGRPWIDPSKVHRILDLCTGSGCIAIAAAMMFPGARVTGTDISPSALQLAHRNVEKHGLEDRVEIIESDLYARISGKYDLIVSNPPYVPTATVAQLPAEYRHEPDNAFDGGEDGLDLVHRIIDQASSYLNDGGALVMEVGESWRALQASRPELPFTWLEAGVEDAGVLLLQDSDLSDV